MHKFYFTNKGIGHWNRLPKWVVSANNIIAFTKGLDQHWQHQDINKKLCYFRGTARIMLVNSCCVSRGMQVKKVSTFKTRKVTSKVIQGHWQWCHSVSHIRFPISALLQLCLYLAPLTIYYHSFPKM